MKKYLAVIVLSLFATSAFAQSSNYPTYPLSNFQSGFRTVDGSQLNNLVFEINNLTGNGSAPSKLVGKSLLINGSTGAATPPTAATGTLVQIVGANATIARVEVDAFGNVPVISLRRADGTIASPTAIVSADELGSLNYWGAKSTTAYYGGAVRVSAFATENWSGTAGGSKLVVSTTPNTTQTLTDVLTIGQDGSLIETSAAAAALAVGRLGSTTPAFVVDASTATSITGIKVKSAGTGGGVAISAVGEASNGALTIDAQGSGTLTLNGTATGAISLARATSITGAITGTSASASSLAVGLNGATNPSFAVDSSTGSQVAGLNVKGAVHNGTVAVAVTDSSGAANLTIDALSTGTIAIGSVSTGNVTITPTAIFAGQLRTTFGTPTIASGACGATTNGVITSGTNQAGLITISSASTTTCTVSFSATLAVAPNACVVFPASSGAAATGTTVARVSSVSTTNFVITGSALASTAYYYICI